MHKVIWNRNEIGTSEIAWRNIIFPPLFYKETLKPDGIMLEPFQGTLRDLLLLRGKSVEGWARWPAANGEPGCLVLDIDRWSIDIERPRFSYFPDDPLEWGEVRDALAYNPIIRSIKRPDDGCYRLTFVKNRFQFSIAGYLPGVQR